MPTVPRSYLASVVLIFFLSLSINLAYVTQAIDIPFFTKLSFDSVSYDQMAVDLIERGPLFGGVYFIGPLYSYFLAVVYILFGRGIETVFFIQSIISALTCAVITLFGAIAFDRRVGLASGILLSIYAPFVFFSAVFLTVNILTLINTCLFFMLFLAHKTGKSVYWMAFGVLLGLSCLGKPNILILVPVIILGDRYIGLGKVSSRSFLIMLVGLMLVLSPVVVRNHLTGGFALVSSNLGYNFFMGNNPDATGTFIPMNKLVKSSGNLLLLGKGGADMNESSKMMQWDADSRFLSKGFDFVVSDPLGYLLLFVKKCFFFINSYEIPQIYNFRFLRGLTLLSFLIPSFSWIAPFAFYSMLNLWRKTEHRAVIACMMAYSLSYVVFFVLGRYRASMVPLMILYCVHCIFGLAKKAKKGTSLKMDVFFLLIFFVLVSNPVFSLEGEMYSGMVNPYNNLGVTYAKEGDHETAILYFAKSIDANPMHVESYNNMGQTLIRLGRFDEAIVFLKRAVELDGDSDYAHHNLGTAYYSKGDISKASAHFQRAVEINPVYFESWANLAAIHMQQNRTDEALAAFDHAYELNPENPDIHYNLGMSLIMSGETDKGLEELKIAAQLDEAYMPEYKRFKGQSFE